MTDPRVPHATILDVARAARVSPATVSRALRGLPNVSDATRARVQQVAADLAYTVSPAASGLASGRTTTIAIVVPYVTRWFFGQVVAGAGDVLREQGYEVLLYELGGATARDRFFDRMPLRRRVDAVLVVSLPMTPGQVEVLSGLQVPVVTVGIPDAPFPCVRIDDAGAAAMGVHHLLNLGHDNVAMISALDDDGMGFTTAQRRRDGHRTAVHDQVAEHLLVAGTWGLGGGAQAMAVLLSAEPLPTAVFVECDELAFGALRTLSRSGLDVPGDVSIVGFDDHEMSYAFDLTTVAQPVRTQGEVAASMLLELLHGRPVEADVVLPTHLVVRGSTAPPSGRLSRSRRARAGAG